MDMQNKIWVLGDSHARAFSYNDNFIPFYIGEGKERGKGDYSLGLGKPAGEVLVDAL